MSSGGEGEGSPDRQRGRRRRGGRVRCGGGKAPGHGSGGVVAECGVSGGMAQYIEVPAKLFLEEFACMLDLGPPTITGRHSSTGLHIVGVQVVCLHGRVVEVEKLCAELLTIVRSSDKNEVMFLERFTHRLYHRVRYLSETITVLQRGGGVSDNSSGSV
uniref:Uncharacterized protein n=1 Tax=Oryza meridionalis TaxID=40149 RepID=A0A0E0F4E8_9ORYZ